jgi:hypothetical protein
MSDFISNEIALNAICPYYTMFPLDFPYSILSKEATCGDEVLDPFCGRGTTNYAARVLGLSSYGVDSSPVAVAISQAKMVFVMPDEIMNAAHELLDQVYVPSHIPDDEFWCWAYEKSVLNLLCRLREGLLQNCTTDSRKALRGIILGALHGPRNKVSRAYFSNQSPRTYAPKPRYAVKFWKTRNLSPEKVNVLNIIETRAKRYFPGPDNKLGSNIQQGDSRDQSVFLDLVPEKKVKWIITSPPYYGMNTYIPDQWIRNWFVGGSSTVEYSTKDQVTHYRPDSFTNDLRKVWMNVADVCVHGAKMIIRFGAINSRKAEHLSIIPNSLRECGWRLIKIAPAGSSSLGRRQSLQFLPNNNLAKNEYDYWVELID